MDSNDPNDVPGNVSNQFSEANTGNTCFKRPRSSLGENPNQSKLLDTKLTPKAMVQTGASGNNDSNRDILSPTPLETPLVWRR